MSHQLIDRNPDWKRLRDEGFAIAIKDANVVVRDVPYVAKSYGIQRGILVCPFTGSGNECRPTNHTVFFAGEEPCDHLGHPLSAVIHGKSPGTYGGIVVSYMFSSKPPSGKYAGFYEQLVSYVNLLSHQAQALDPTVTAQTFAPLETDPEESVFNYFDSASSRAGIDGASEKLKRWRIAIVGLGGTGSYILDLVAKCPVAEIHLWDRDYFQNHNAFRAPGAASIEELHAQPRKVDYLKGIYARMHRGVIPHAEFLSAENVNELQGMSFVFLAMDPTQDKELILRKLQEWDIPFIDVGMGLKLVSDRLLGIVRSTTSSRASKDHIWLNERIPFGSIEQDGNEYGTNIQVADLNALNAALAVIRWKKLLGFYADMEGEHNTHFVVSNNLLLNDDAVGR